MQRKTFRRVNRTEYIMVIRLQIKCMNKFFCCHGVLRIKKKNGSHRSKFAFVHWDAAVQIKQKAHQYLYMKRDYHVCVYSKQANFLCLVLTIRMLVSFHKRICFFFFWISNLRESLSECDAIRVQFTPNENKFEPNSHIELEIIAFWKREKRKTGEGMGEKAFTR